MGCTIRLAAEPAWRTCSYASCVTPSWRFDFICFAAGILLPKLSRSTFLCDGAVAEEEQLSTALALAAGAFSGSTASGMQVVALLGELDEILIVVLPLRSEASCGAASCRSEWA